MKMRAAILCVVLYLELTAAQNQLQVYRGNLVHSRELQQIEVLQDYLLGFDANGGEVCATAGNISVISRPSHRSVFDHLQYATTEGETLVHFIT